MRGQLAVIGGILVSLITSEWGLSAPPSPGNRLTYLDSDDPFHVGVHFPKLTTPQWAGDPGVEVVVMLSIDDMSQSAKYETFLRPILDRLKQIDGHAPLSIFCNSITPSDPQLQAWLKEGVSLEVHTLNHPCPILARHDFIAAQNTFHGGVELLNLVPNSTPVAFRTPCCDSINSASPRLFAELFNRTNQAGQFLRLDSSVVLLLTTNDPALPRRLVQDPDGRGRFTKYVPFPSFVGTVENYPYPWVIGKTAWEFAFAAPTDWEAQNILGSTNATMLADWQAALDAIVLKQGTFNFCFHPHGWSAPRQFVDFIDYATATYGSRVKFLSYGEAEERLTRHLGAGQPLRAMDGSDNGVRVVDINNDGFLDVLIGNDTLRRTRLWQPESKQWLDTELPTQLMHRTSGIAHDPGVRFGVLHSDGRASMLVRNEQVTGAWSFDNGRWIEVTNFLRGLELDGQPVLTSRGGRDRGVRLRDMDGDGICELLVANESQNAVFRWEPARERWERLTPGLPPGTSIVNARGDDNGLRFADINEDGFDDLVFSNENAFALWLYVPEPFLGWTQGWTRKVTAGLRGQPRAQETPADEIPPIVRTGPFRNNGSWIHSRQLWVQNEDTAHLPDLVDRRSFDTLLRGVTPAPKSPEEALRSFRVPTGFRVELVAAEPLVQDPVAFDWGADGKLWVVEMRDYPLGMDGQGKPGGVVKFLEDTDGDGRYDRATEFLRDVRFPSAVMPWGRGAFVSAAPEIFYAEDTDGDGRADVRRVLFTGFVEGNQQHRVNGFALGLDGWIYCANGDSGGDVQWSGRREIDSGSGWTLVQTESLPGAKTNSVSLRGRDFRFRPDTGEFETIEGQTQYGRNRDDWGDWFGNANYTWLWHYPIPSRYVARNPHQALRDTRSMLARYDGGDRVFPASRSLPRPNVVGVDNTVTSACSPCPYRDDLFGPEFATSIFISEPSENLIHREVLAESGATFSSHRAHGEETSEFLASTDNWFRPVQLKTGPDGALYVADMYRQTIEHPEWIPPDVRPRMDLRAGADRGRIYRVVPERATLRPIPRLDQLDSAGLAAAMNSSNGWQRDTAMRLLWERGGQEAVAALRTLATDAADPRVRLQALATVAGLGQSDPKLIVLALRDAHPAVRATAIRLGEPWLRTGSDPALAAAILQKTNDPSARVALQLALSLGELSDPDVGPALAQITLTHPEDPWILEAVISSASPHGLTMLKALEETPRPSARLLERLLALAAAQRNEEALAQGFAVALKLDPQRDGLTQFSALGGLLDALDRQSQRKAARIPWADLEPILTRAGTIAFSADAEEPLRLAALRMVGRSESEPVNTASLLVKMLGPQNSTKVQEAALAALRRRGDANAASALLESWVRLSPAIRSAALEAFVTQPSWTSQLLDALESGRLAAREINVPIRQQLLHHSDARLAARAEKLLTATRSDRQAVVDSFAAVRKLPGDAERGREQFRANCSSCHRLEGEGVEVGPDLGAVVDKSADALLVAVLDPNRAVEARYLSYSAETRSGRQFTGIIASESPNSLTLRGINGTEEVFLRNELVRSQSTGQSLMPEGFEHSLDAPALADLFAYVTASGPAPKKFAGNHPQTVSPDATGALRLLATVAEIFGDSLVYESRYHNLGYWQNENDRAAWTLQIPRGGEYDVWLDWARPAGERTVTLRLDVAGVTREFIIPATGSWDTYQQTRLGQVRIEAGRQRVSVRGVPPLEAAILDLREIRLVPVGKGAPADFRALTSR
ncbi:MAG TPA: FG-GAP-like repeat-containing protein [Verrucomicrobiota bacterium]|nr:FG-GAP-like repeat-containing protein [Verrucomicrobiota bacterium]